MSKIQDESHVPFIFCVLLRIDGPSAIALSRRTYYTVSLTFSSSVTATAGVFVCTCSLHCFPQRASTDILPVYVFRKCRIRYEKVESSSLAKWLPPCGNEMRFSSCGIEGPGVRGTGVTLGGFFFCAVGSRMR
jgi:hypothetical protein